MSCDILAFGQRDGALHYQRRLGFAQANHFVSCVDPSRRPRRERINLQSRRIGLRAGGTSCGRRDEQPNPELLRHLENDLVVIVQRGGIDARPLSSRT
jgi:hypothetical protein